MKKQANIHRGRCVACGVCVKECPKSALSVWKGCFAAVDSAACVGCGKCVRACPAGCITLTEKEVTA